MILAPDTLHKHTKLQPYRHVQSKVTLTEPNSGDNPLPSIKCTLTVTASATISTPADIPVKKYQKSIKN